MKSGSSRSRSSSRGGKKGGGGGGGGREKGLGEGGGGLKRKCETDREKKKGGCSYIGHGQNRGFLLLLFFISLSLPL